MQLMIPCNIQPTGSGVRFKVSFSNDMKFDGNTMEEAAGEVYSYYSGWWQYTKDPALISVSRTYEQDCKVFVGIEFFHLREKILFFLSSICLGLFVYMPTAGFVSWTVAQMYGGGELIFPVEGGRDFLRWVYGYSYATALGYLIFLVIWIQFLFPIVLRVLQAILLKVTWLRTVYRVLVCSWILVGLVPDSLERGISDDAYPD